MGFADADMKERMQEKSAREQLDELLRKLPLSEALYAVRARIQHEDCGGPRAKAILTRYIEDAIVWEHALKSDLFP